MKKTSWIVSPAPFLLTRPTVSRMSVITGLTLLPQLIMLLFEKNAVALISVGLAITGSLLAELCSSLSKRKNTFGDGTAIIAGILTGLLLPSTLNPFLILTVSFTGILIARVLFGGIGSYWMNPVATVICIAFISQSAAFPPFLINGDGVQTVGNAFDALRLDHFNQLPTDQSITSSLNLGFLRHFGIKLPEGYITLFWNSPSVIPAFRYNMLTLVSSIFLIALNIIDWIIPLFFLLTYSLCLWFLSLVPFASTFYNGDVLFGLLTSGTLFVAFYVLPEYTTTPRTQAGKIISGTLAGLTAFFLCGPGGSSVGAVFTVVLISAINPVIEYIENRLIGSVGDLA